MYALMYVRVRVCICGRNRLFSQTHAPGRSLQTARTQEHTERNDSRSLCAKRCTWRFFCLRGTSAFSLLGPIYVQIHVHMHIGTYESFEIVYTCKQINIHIHSYMNMYIHTCTYKYVDTYMYKCIYVYMSGYMDTYVCIYIYIYINE